MAFSRLPLELRTRIYQELLCPPEGIYLHCDSERCSCGKQEPELNGEYDDSNNDLECDDNGDKFDKATSMTPIATAILYTNRQLHTEVSKVLYGSNRFTFNAAPVIALRFLKNLPPAFASFIKHIAFTNRATVTDVADCIKCWHLLCDFISSHMQLITVTIQLPRDPYHAIDGTKVVDPPQGGVWFWWPAVNTLTGMLMERKIQKLRLAYTVTYLHCGEDEDLEDYNAIKCLRHPQWQEEFAREDQERRDFQAASEAGRPQKFTSSVDLLNDQITRRQRLDFAVSREDNVVGDMGTVLVLTRPHNHSEDASAK